MKLNDKIRLAATGNPSDLAQLLHEKNPRVVDAMLSNPRMPVDMVVQLVRRNATSEEHIHSIVAHREWMKEYLLKLELVLNPRTPRTESLRLMKDIMIRDLAVVSKKVTLHPALREVAINYLRLRLESMRAGEKISIARTAPIAFLQHLMEESDLRILNAAMVNYRLTEEVVLQFISPGRRSSAQLEVILSAERWSRNPRILKMLARHPNLNFAARQKVYEGVPLPYLTTMSEAPQLDENHRNLAGFVLRQRLMELSLEDQVRVAGSPSNRLLFFLGSVMKAPAVVRAWLRNPNLTVAVIEQAIEKNMDASVREWLMNRRVPDGPAVPEDAQPEDAQPENAQSGNTQVDNTQSDTADSEERSDA